MADQRGEFQKLIDNPGVLEYITCPLAPASTRSGTRRMGDNASARESYEEFLTIWKDATPIFLSIDKPKRVRQLQKSGINAMINVTSLAGAMERLQIVVSCGRPQRPAVLNEDTGCVDAEPSHSSRPSAEKDNQEAYFYDGE